MQRLLLVLVLAACDKGAAPTPPVPAAGSATPHPTIADAAVADTAIADAAVAKLAITQAGVGPLGHYAWWKQDETANAKTLEAALSVLPKVKVEFTVMDVPATVETEEGYWSVKRGDKELVQVLRQTDENGPTPAAVIVWTPELPTADGTHVGDPLATVIAKHADVACTYDPDQLVASLVAASIQCHSPAEPAIIYILDVQASKLKKRAKVTPAQLAKLAIVAIAHVP